MTDENITLNAYIASSKGDDYGFCIKELVITTEKNANQYYSAKLVDPNDVAVLKKYLSCVEHDDEQQRSKEQRFYGNGDD